MENKKKKLFKTNKSNKNPTLETVISGSDTALGPAERRQEREKSNPS